MPRLFTALEIPSEIVQSMARLRGGLPGARWVEPENYHLTLRFIGDVVEAEYPIADETALLRARVVEIARRRSKFKPPFPILFRSSQLAPSPLLPANSLLANSKCKWPTPLSPDMPRSLRPEKSNAIPL